MGHVASTGRSRALEYRQTGARMSDRNDPSAPYKLGCQFDPAFDFGRHCDHMCRRTVLDPIEKAQIAVTGIVFEEGGTQRTALGFIYKRSFVMKPQNFSA